MLETCILLNGAPNVGKDTIANLMVPNGFTKMEFKARLYKDTADHFIVSLDELKRRATDRILKETPWPALYLSPNNTGRVQYLTPRQALIHVSQNIIKPLYGDTYFGDAAAQECARRGLKHVVFSDSGFPDETNPIITAFDTVAIFRLHRKGCSWGNDSRGYLEGFPNTFDLFLEDGNPQRAVADILRSVVQLPDQEVA